MSDDREPSLGEVLFVEAKHDGSQAAILVVGELDLAGTAQFWACFSEALGANPESVTVDARGLTFIDSSGLMALVRAREAVVGAGVAFRVRDPSPAVCRVVELSGTEDLLASS